ncbi:ABC transporter ATP-binding protein [Paenibacillus tarimensis]
MAIELIGISKKFGSFTALHPIDLTVRDGEFVALLGPSGCGKTTLLRIMAGFEAPTTGELRLNGIVASSPNRTVPPEKRNINMVFQSFALWPHLNVKEHVKFPLDHHPFLPAEMKRNKERRAAEVLELVGLNEMAGRYPGQLSGGQRQRVALARAIASQPSLLLMDEPLSNLDAELRMEMRKEIQHIHRITKTAVVYVTHDQGEALAMADRIVVMKNGKIEQIGTPRQIYCFPETEFVASFVGKANLVKGEWCETGFVPDVTNARFVWPNGSISDTFRKNGTYPVRPEQFRIVREGKGIPGIVSGVQYQGKEIHYAIEVKEQIYTVHEDVNADYRPGDSVVMVLRNSEMSAEDSATDSHDALCRRRADQLLTGTRSTLKWSAK